MLGATTGRGTLESVIRSVGQLPDGIYSDKLGTSIYRQVGGWWVEINGRMTDGVFEPGTVRGLGVGI